MFPKKKVNPLAQLKIEKVDFRDAALLKRFVSDNGRILPRRMTGVTAKQQRDVAKAIKRARMIALLPYTDPSGGIPS